MQPNSYAVGALSAALGAGALVAAPSALALNNFEVLWQLQYPASQSDDNAGCAICHNDTSNALNPYGADWRAAWPSANPTEQELVNALIAVEGLDSDADPTGSSNIAEINADTQPGWAEGDNPQGVAGDLDPVLLVGCVPALSTAVLDFGAVELGSTALRTATITNSGDEPCGVEAVVFTDSAEFALESAASFSVGPLASVDVEVSYTPFDETSDTGSLSLTFPEEIVNVQLVGSGGSAVDLAIKSFRASSSVSLSRGQGIVDLGLVIENVGTTEGLGSATITGVQNGAVVYAQTLPVTDGVGGGSTRYTLQSFIPSVTGVITWTAVVTDGVPDEDVATATTTVRR